VSAAEADMDAHAVTVEFDDEKASLEAIIGALHEAGYTTGEAQKQ
jgi:copper chaperone CopZ